MVLDRDKLKKLLKEKGVKDLDDFNAFMREVSKDAMIFGPMLMTINSALKTAVEDK